MNILTSAEDNISAIFTVVEDNLICIFDTSSRTALIKDIVSAMPDFQEPELREIAEGIIKKLEAITDTEFLKITFIPSYFDETEE